MTLALRGFIVGLLFASCAAYFYKPSFLVVCVAFFLGHLLGLAVLSIPLLLDRGKND